MNKHHPYTEEEIQAYATGNFTGDAVEFKKHLDANSSLQEEVDLYCYLFSGISQQTPARLSFDLSDAVLQKLPVLEEKQTKKLPVTWYFGLIAIVFLWIYFPVVSKYLSVDVETTALAGFAILLFVLIFHLAEYKRKSRLYAGLI